MKPVHSALPAWVLVGLLSGPVVAKNLGIQGTVFPIAELDMLAWIDQRLRGMEANGELAKMQKDMQDRVRARVKRPEPVPGLTRATREDTFTVDPTLTLKEPITDQNGKILYPKGLRINPFDTTTWPQGARMPDWKFSQVLLFVDADDGQQRRWLQQQKAELGTKAKVVLVGGEPGALQRTLGGRVYFDQQGNLSRRLQLRHVPSRVEREDTHWRVREVDVSTLSPLPLEPEGDEK